MTRTAVTLLISLSLLALPMAAQEPPPEQPQEDVDPQAAPQAEPEIETPTEEPSEELEREEAQQEEAPEEDAERELTPKEEEAQRKEDEKAAKREARREKRAEKETEEEAKLLEKEARQEEKKNERVAELADLGYAAIEAEKYKDARDRFEKIRELEGGKSYAADMGLAHIQLAHANYAESIQLAQRAAKATLDNVERAEAMTFAGNTTLAARPLLDDGSGRPQPGSEMFVDAALRFFIRAIAVAPAEATEARARLEQRFPGSEPDERTTRLLEHYFELVENAEMQHGRRVAAAYEALLAGRPSGNKPIAAISPLTPPTRLSGPRPTFTAEDGRKTRRRLIVGMVIAEDGTVSSAKVLNGVHPLQDRAVVEALLEWSFEPARLPNGTAVTAYWLQGVTVKPE